MCIFFLNNRYVNAYYAAVSVNSLSEERECASIETILYISVSICIEKSIFLTTLLQNIYERGLECSGWPGSLAEINDPKYNKQINGKPVPIFTLIWCLASVHFWPWLKSSWKILRAFPPFTANQCCRTVWNAWNLFTCH